MRFNKRVLPYAVLLVLPVAVVLLRLPWWAAALAAAATLLVAWVFILLDLGIPERGPRLVLDTIGASHFVEKVRWCMDRLGIDYVEEQSVGVIGVWFTGRTVPRLRARTGMVTSSIGNSADILRYLWGRYQGRLGEKAAFLEPTAEAVELERRFDIYGVELQRWVYAHAFTSVGFTLKVWGAWDKKLPVWQRATVVLLYPMFKFLMKRAFGIRPSGLAKAQKEIELLLSDIEERLGDGRRTLLGGDEISFVDITFASLSALWVIPDGYAGGRSDAVVPTEEDLPPSFVEHRNKWKQEFPRATAFVERMYEARTGAEQPARAAA